MRWLVRFIDTVVAGLGFGTGLWLALHLLGVLA